MKITKSYLRILLTIIAIILVFLVNPFQEDLWDLNAKLLKEQALSIDETNEEVILTDITPFEWDAAYSFTPYTSKEKIYQTIGYKWDNISETVDEGMNQIVFVKDGKVVCYLYGYPANNGFGIYFAGTEHKDGAAIIYAKDNLNFKIEERDKILYLSHN